MQTSQVIDFIRSARDEEWNVIKASQVLVELPGVLNSWLVTSEYSGASKHVLERAVYDLVCEKDGKLYNFDVTELVKLNKQVAVLDAQEQAINNEQLRTRLIALGYSEVVLDHDEVYVEDEDRMVRVGFVTQVAGMTDAAIIYEVEAEITSQEENEEAGWA